MLFLIGSIMMILAFVLRKSASYDDEVINKVYRGDDKQL